MAENESFEHLADLVVRQIFPQQQKFWMANKRQLTQRIMDSDIASNEVATEGDFKFVAELVTAMEVASSAASLLASLAAIYATLGNSNSDRTAKLDRLGKSLKNAKVVAEQAEKIVKIVDDAMR